jgi:hypothetical protein
VYACGELRLGAEAKVYSRTHHQPLWADTIVKLSNQPAQGCLEPQAYGPRMSHDAASALKACWPWLDNTWRDTVAADARSARSMYVRTGSRDGDAQRDA